jgi:hypothetical protein
MKRLLNNYGNSSSIIIWAIGNEVSGSWNHAWFTWTVSYHDYLNQLYSYVRNIDQNRRPIMYSKYFGEDFDFINLNAEIIAINSYTHPASDLGSEFVIPATGARAYMLGEFGHIIGHASGHWNLSKQHAGGLFLEYNDVWWKGSGYYFGIVDADRNVSYDRYEVLRQLFNGTGIIEYDTSPPIITILSPLNITYHKSDISLNFTLNEKPFWIGYSLDGYPNVTITGNTILTGLSNGTHNIIVYANDVLENMGKSNKVYFTVSAPPFCPHACSESIYCSRQAGYICGNYQCLSGYTGDCCCVYSPPKDCETEGGECMRDSMGCSLFCKGLRRRGICKLGDFLLGYYPGCSVGDCCCKCS